MELISGGPMLQRSRRRVIFIACIGASLATAACTPAPPGGGDPIHLGACFEKTGTFSFAYTGPANAFHNVSIHASADCSDTTELEATVVFAANSSAALERCIAVNAEFESTEQLSATGWVASGTTTPINNRVWGCGPAL